MSRMNVIKLDKIPINVHGNTDAMFIHTYLFRGAVSEGAAVVREAPAEAAARLRRQQEAVFLQDHDLFFQTHYLTYRASWHLYKKFVLSVIASGHHQQEVVQQS